VEFVNLPATGLPQGTRALIANLQQDVAARLAALTAEENAHKQTQDLLANAQTDLARIEGENGQLQRDLTAARAADTGGTIRQVVELERRVVDLQNALATKTQEHKDAIEVNKVAMGIIPPQVKEELRQLKQTVADHERTIEGLDAECKRAEARTPAEATTQVAQLTEQLRAAQEFEPRMREAETTAANLQGRLDLAIEMNNTKDETIRELQEEVGELRAQAEAFKNYPNTRKKPRVSQGGTP